MRIISLAVQKGGTGKTTTAVNLAAALAMQKHRVLLIDLDSQANATECLTDLTSIEPAQSIRSLFLEGRGVSALIRHSTGVPGLDFVPSHPAILIDEYFGRITGIASHMLQNALADLPAEYEFVLCDCPPNLMHFTRNALVASDFLLIPVEPEPLAVDGLRQLVTAILPDIQQQNPRLALLGVAIVNRAPGTRRYIPAAAKADIDRLVPGARLSSEVRLDQQLTQMRVHNQPVFVYAPFSNGASDYQALAAEIVQRLQ